MPLSHIASRRGPVRLRFFFWRDTRDRDFLPMKTTHGGYTLIELVVAVGVFALIMTLASGAYLIMIGVNRQAQSTATGIHNLSFVLESLTRTARTGTAYNLESASSFSLMSQDDTKLTYSLGPQSGPNGTVGTIMLNGVPL